MSKNQTTKISIACITTALVTTGCIDMTSDENHNVGKFIDSPVVGLSYKTDTQEGRTNIAGEFKYADGEYVLFSIGDISLPLTVAQPIVTPLNLVDTNDPADTEVVNILRLLQTLDKDADPENGIEISQEAHVAAEGVTLDLGSEDFASSQETTQYLEAVLGKDAALVDATQAIEHFTASLSLTEESPAHSFSANELDNQTYYLVEENNLSSARGVDALDNVYFDNGQFEYIKNDSKYTGQYSIRNGILHLDYDSSENLSDTYVAIQEKESNHLITCWAATPLSSLGCEKEDLTRLFTSSDSAIEFVDSINGTTIAGSGSDTSTSGSTDTQGNGNGSDTNSTNGSGTTDTNSSGSDNVDNTGSTTTSVSNNTPSNSNTGTDSGTSDSGSTDTGTGTDTNANGNGSTDTSTDTSSNGNGSTDTSTDTSSNGNSSTDTSTDTSSNGNGSTDTSTDTGSNGNGSTDTSTDTSSNGNGSTDTSTDTSSSGNSGEPALGAASNKGTKFNPGHYVFTNISRRYSKDERGIRRINFINQYKNSPNIKGFVGTYDWKYLELSKNNYDFDNIREILKMLEGTDKHYALYIKERSFSGSCTKPPVPDYLMGYKYKYSGYVCMIKLYKEEVMDRQIALFKALGKEFDNHPNLEFISTGETTIGGSDGYSGEVWTNQLIRFFQESKKSLPHTVINIQMNFLESGTKYMDRIAAAMAETGGGGLGLPDTVPCRRTDIPSSDVCGYTIPGYDVLRKFNGKLAIMPDVETWDLIYEQTPEVLDMAVDYLGATHVVWQSEFSSRVDSRGYVPNYLENQIIPTVDSQGGRINDTCPANLAPCL